MEIKSSIKYWRFWQHTLDISIFKNKLRNSAIEMSAYHTLSIFYETVLDKDFF